MNFAIHHRGSLTTSASTRTDRRSSPTGHRSRTADYVADIVLIALLAAPFVLLEAPATLSDAVDLSRSAPATMSQPAPVAGEQNAASADGR